MTKHSKDILKTKQYDFLNKEIWLLTFGGGFQRAHIYKYGLKNNYQTELDKSEFRDALSSYIETLIPTYKKGDISERKHIENIKKVQRYSKHYAELLNEGQINFGVAQKLLNLYLKYLWCLERIPEPPHFPVDRVIQEQLNIEAKLQGIKQRKVTSWTKFEDEVPYLDIIKFAKKLSNKSLAQLELELFSRR